MGRDEVSDGDLTGLRKAARNPTNAMEAERTVSLTILSLRKPRVSAIAHNVRRLPAPRAALSGANAVSEGGNRNVNSWCRPPTQFFSHHLAQQHPTVHSKLKAGTSIHPFCFLAHGPFRR